jgi:hypothetical protein
MNLARTEKKTQQFFITNISWLIIFREIIIAYCERIVRNPLVQNVVLLIVKAGGTYSYHWAL